MTTKILALTDALGNLVRFELLPGQRFDTIGVAPLMRSRKAAASALPAGGERFVSTASRA